MYWLTFLCFSILAITQLQAEPIKVPNEIYAGSGDKRIHTGHYPFISYLTFRNICDKIIDDSTEWFDPELVQEGDTIYLNIWYLDWFVNHVHDRIPVPYILVTADVGAWVPYKQYKKLLYDPKLTAWFCRNIVFSYHPKIFQIPTGQDLGQFILDDPKITFYLLNAVLHEPKTKKHLMYMTHYPRPHGDRDVIAKLFENEPYVLTHNRNHDKHTFVGVDRPTFYREMASCQFVLSPLGLETDSVRTWEALVLDAIPIVEHTFLDPTYDRLPVIMVHDWEEINPEFLEQKYHELKDRSREEAYFDYWFTLVKDSQKKVRNQTATHNQLEATLFSPEDLSTFASILHKVNPTNSPIFYTGLLCALRPFQVANFCDSEVYLFDHYLDHSILENLDQFVQDPSILENQNRVHYLSQWNEFADLAQASNPSTYFIDFSYYRSSFYVNFNNCVIEEGNFRHSLKKDLNKLYKTLFSKSTIFGNMADNDYVKKVLDLFSAENNIPVQREGSFWYFTVP